MTRDVVIGVVAGVAALVAVRWAGPAAAPLPQGVYQASLDQKKYREMLETLRPAQATARDVRARLETRLDKFRLVNRRIDQVVSDLADVAGVDVAVDWAAIGSEVSRDQPVTLDLTGWTVGSALRKAMTAVNDSAELSFLIGADGVRVTSAERAAHEAVTRVYDVRAIVRGFAQNDRSLHVRRVPPATLPFRLRRDSGLFGRGAVMTDMVELGGPANPGDFATDERKFTDAVIKVIEERVDPTSWRDAGGTVGGIWELGGVLVVSQTISNQDDVALMLEWLHRLYAEGS